MVSLVIGVAFEKNQRRGVYGYSAISTMKDPVKGFLFGGDIKVELKMRISTDENEAFFACESKNSTSVVVNTLS